MKKLIDLPDNKIKKLKKLAIESEMSFKKWIEYVILAQLK